MAEIVARATLPIMFRIQKQFSRLYHFSSPLFAVDKSNLALLRKKTGFALSNCKQALECQQNDIEKAEKWLNDEAVKLGWSKASTMPIKKLNDGLIGLKITDNRAVMAEINCDTDFVAFNSIFISLMGNTLRSCHNMLANHRFLDDYNKILLNQDEIQGLIDPEGNPLSEQIMMTLNKVKENIVTRRAICVQTTNDVHLAGYTHRSQRNAELDFEYGKFAALLAYQLNPDSNTSIETGQEIARELCQHIVGLNPVKIGSLEHDEPNPVTDDETCLIFQTFLLDEDVSVSRLLDQYGIKLIDFQRFQCGQHLDSSIVEQSLDNVETCQ